MSSPALVLGLSEIDSVHAPLVGGKAFHLAQLHQAGFPVPDGFCLTTSATESWGDAAKQALLDAYRRMGGGAVAVRSSALEEDGEDASYAGIFCSVLGVSGEYALLHAVEQCVASLHAPLASQYRETLGIATAPAMAVLILRMVAARSAGIAYTSAPLDSARRNIYVNAVWGLAEPLASGRVEGDGFVVSRSGKLLQQNVAGKPFKLTATGEQNLPEAMRTSPSLSDAEAKKVAKLAIKAEKFFGRPQDVEFAFDHEQLWLLQSRPIAVTVEDAVEVTHYLRRERTRLTRKCAQLRRNGHISGSDIVYSNGNIGELLPTPTTMSFGLFRRVFAGKRGGIVSGRLRLGYRFEPRVAEHLFDRIAGQPYFNLELDASTFDYGASPPVQFYLNQVLASPALANYPEVNLYCQHYASMEDTGSFDDQAAGRKALEAAAGFRTGLVLHARDFLARFSSDIEPGLRRRDRHDWESLSAAQSIKGINALILELRTFACVEFVVAARLGFYFAALTRRRLKCLIGSDSDALYAALLSGLPGSLVTQQTLCLEQVSRGEMEIETFLDHYGHVARNELEIAEPRLNESPAILKAMLHDMHHSGRSAAKDFADKVVQRGEAETRLEVRMLACGIAPGEVRDLREDLRFAQQFLPLRETIKHHYTARYAEIRRGLQRLEGLLNWDSDLIFHLYPEELPRTLRDPKGMSRKAAARKKDWTLAAKAVRQQSLPDVIFASNLMAIGRSIKQSNHELLLQGTPLSPGRVRGIARVIDPAMIGAEKFSSNEILILRSANLGIAPLLRVVAGMVVEVGGLLAHGACQAREAGVPAVVLPEATHLIKNGVTVCLDGNIGTVEIVMTEQHRESDHGCSYETV
ncbi:phosphoenolpyruvate synthase [mine drainage metagenome]|uniref:Phosphoenolpyruvate synthase n=1 Tax=mine drainage metagenome TaxID=410659 RepID=A0A1J5RT09_9ZZZZ